MYGGNGHLMVPAEVGNRGGDVIFSSTQPHTAEKLSASRTTEMVSRWCDCVHAQPELSPASSGSRDQSDFHTHLFASAIATEFTSQDVCFAFCAPMERVQR